MQRLLLAAGAGRVQDHIARLALLAHSEAVWKEAVEAFDERRPHLEERDDALDRLQLVAATLVEVSEGVDELAVDGRAAGLLHLQRKGAGYTIIELCAYLHTSGFDVFYLSWKCYSKRRGVFYLPENQH